MAGKGAKGSKGGVIIKKFEIVEGGHHGGAWKVAYADFVTAMMAFFLLMWLLNATTEDQRKGLADYFSPNNLLSHASSGVGQPFGGHTAFVDGALVSDKGSVQIVMGKRPTVKDVENGEVEITKESLGFRSDHPQAQEHQDDAAAYGQAALRMGQDPTAASLAGRTEIDGQDQADPMRAPTEAEIRAEKERQERAEFEAAAEQIKEAVRGDPALKDLANQLAIDMTPEGLRIQILDEVRSPMFATGSAVPNERARLLLQKIGPVLQRLPQQISIAGHTDAAPFPGPERTNWELSAERANATRRLLVEGGLPVTRIRTVTGHAERDPLLPADPFAAANRRIAVVVLREALTAKPADAPTPAPAPGAH
ncbi:MAG: flagellar motor protein MotB [Acetobacteraceae bacterium]